MTELTKMKELLTTALEQIDKYESKSTKAASARIRKALSEVKKNISVVRTVLLDADKA